MYEGGFTPFDATWLWELYSHKVDWEVMVRPPKTDVEFINRYLPNKLWRMNALYTIKDKRGKLRRFVMNEAQHIVYSELLSHPRLIILKSRQRGISTFMLLNYLDRAIFYDGVEGGMMAQGEKEMENLFDKVKLAWENMPKEVIEWLKVSTVKDNTKTFEWSNRSKLYIQLSFRSGTLQMLHISEYAKITSKYPDRADETRSGTLQAILPDMMNWIVIESTAEGDNDFKYMWDSAVEDGGGGVGSFHPVFLSWLSDADCVSDDRVELDNVGREYFKELEEKVGKIDDRRKWWWAIKFKELGRSLDLILREYPAVPEDAFYTSVEGTWYKNEYQFLVGAGRFGCRMSDLYDPDYKVCITFDLGVDDYTSILFSQHGSRDRYLLYKEGGDRPISWWLKAIDDELNDRNWEVGLVILPHDSVARHISANETVYTQVGRWAAQKGGCRVIVLDKPHRIVDHINRVRELVPRMYFSTECGLMRLTLQNYKKKYDKINNVYTDKDVHDRWSHPADCLRYNCQANWLGIIKSNAEFMYRYGYFGLDDDTYDNETIKDGLAL